VIADWFAAKGWSPRRHQLEMLAAARAGRNALLVAPTGAGKTLAGFLPSLVELIERSSPGFPGEGDHPKGGGGVEGAGLRRLAPTPRFPSQSALHQASPGPPPHAAHGEDQSAFARSPITFRS
jgi:hypothetical protein